MLYQNYQFGPSDLGYQLTSFFFYTPFDRDILLTRRQEWPWYERIHSKLVSPIKGWKAYLEARGGKKVRTHVKAREVIVSSRMSSFLKTLI